MSREIEQCQLKLDGIVSELSQAEARLAQGSQLMAALQQAEAAHASAPSPESLKLPPDIVERAKRFPHLLAKREEALAKLDNERSGELRPMAYVQPLSRNLQFWAAAALGTALFASAIVLGGAGRYLALLDIPAFGFAAIVAIRYVDDLQRAERNSRRGERRAAREKKILDDFEGEAQSVKKAMAALRVDSPNDIVEVLGRRAQLQQTVTQLRAQAASLTKDPEYAAAVAKEQQLRRERESIEATLNEKGGYIRDAAEVQREIDRLRKSIDAPAGGASAPSTSPAPSLAAAPPGLDDGFPALIALAADVLMVDAPTATGVIRDRCTQRFLSFTDRRYGGLEFDRTGKVFAISSGQRMSSREMPAKDFDLLYLSFRLSLAEASASRGQMPLIVDDLRALLGSSGAAVLGGVLKQLGAATQVLHVTADPGAAALADSTVSL
jgi:hypothetical protein